MKLPMVLSLAAIIAGLASAKSTTNYDDLVAKGYRWVTVDGPYACVSKDDLRQIIKNRNTEPSSATPAPTTSPQSTKGSHAKTHEISRKDAKILD
jgi:hypothetical protein